MQSDPDKSSGLQRQSLSLLADGELPPGELAAVLAGFGQRGAVRADWHAYQLIGDVLRSDDLAVAPARDEQFLRALRQRLALEPLPRDVPPLVVAVPPPLAEAAEPAEPAEVAPRRSERWLVAPAAVAAGFVAVAAVLVVNKAVVAPPAAPVMAQAPAAPAVLVRDAQLDRYLAAHRNLGTGVTGAGGAQRTVQIVYEPK